MNVLAPPVVDAPTDGIPSFSTEPERARQPVADGGLAFPFNIAWRNQDGEWKRPKRAPIRARTGYAKAVAAYYLENADARES